MAPTQKSAGILSGPGSPGAEAGSNPGQEALGVGCVKPAKNPSRRSFPGCLPAQLARSAPHAPAADPKANPARYPAPQRLAVQTPRFSGRFQAMAGGGPLGQSIRVFAWQAGKAGLMLQRRSSRQSSSGKPQDVVCRDFYAKKTFPRKSLHVHQECQLFGFWQGAKW